MLGHFSAKQNRLAFMSSWGFRFVFRLWQMRSSQPYCSSCDIAACSVLLPEAAALKQSSRTSSILRNSSQLLAPSSSWVSPKGLSPRVQELIQSAGNQTNLIGVNRDLLMKKEEIWNQGQVTLEEPNPSVLMCREGFKEAKVQFCQGWEGQKEGLVQICQLWKKL